MAEELEINQKGKPMSKISPEPWSLEPKHMDIIDANGILVASVYYETKVDDATLANARAIVEVPEMIKIAKDYEYLLARLHTNTPKKAAEILKNVRALLARIEGKDE